MPTLTDARRQALADAIREIRNRKRLSQDELSQRAELNRKTVGNIERVQYMPSFGALVSIADGLEVPLSELIRVYEERLDG